MTHAVGSKGPTNDDGRTVVDVKLFKAIGLYYILWPGGRRCREALVVVLWLTFGLQCVQSVRLYLAAGDVQLATYLAVLIANGLMGLYKGRVLVTNADRLRSVLDAARFEFACGGCGPAMSRCRATVSAVLRTFAALSYGTLVIWLAMPDSVRQTRSENGGSSSDTALPIRFIETIVLFVNVFCWTTFDCYAVTVCFALKTHFYNVSAAYETLGRLRNRTHSPTRNAEDDNIGININNTNNYSELNYHMAENQKILKKLDDFFDLVRPVILLQIANSSFELIILIFLTLMAYITNLTIISVTFFQFFFGSLSIVIELYIYCYTFNELESVKSNVNFGLYSSDWTTMDLKCKKTIYLAMIMNSSHKKVMKFSPYSIINLEIFVRVLKLSYSITSVIVNSELNSSGE